MTVLGLVTTQVWEASDWIWLPLSTGGMVCRSMPEPETPASLSK